MGQLAVALKAIPGDADDWPALVRIAARHEPGLVRLLRTSWDGSQRAVDERALQVACLDQDAAAVLAACQVEAADGAMVRTVRPKLAGAFLDGVEAGLELLRDYGIAVSLKREGVTISFDAVNAEAVRWARRHAGELVTSPAAARAAVQEIINLLVSSSQLIGIPPRELARQIFRVMRAGVIGLDPRRQMAVARFERNLVEAGISEADVARRVARYADAQRRARALVIARTETIAALNHGQQALWMQARKQGVLGTDLGKTWITTADDLTCPLCERLDGEVVPVDEAFSAGMVAPPRHPNCRCATGLAPLPKKAIAARRR